MSSLQPGLVSRLAPGVRRIVAPNPGVMTGPGTNTWLVGLREVAVIDPGPAIDRHIDTIVDAAGVAIRWILVTHTHSDHSPGALLLAKRTGAALLGRPAPQGQHQDASFQADRVLDDGDSLAGTDFELDVIATPGHASNHLCYRHVQLGWLFTGDHIIHGSTVVIDPPDGNMSHYLESLERLKDFELAAIAPGHGEVIDNPYEAIDWIVDHRLQRERRVETAVREEPNLTTTALVARVYADTDASLHDIAERSLLAHLEKLAREGRIRRAGDRWQPC